MRSPCGAAPLDWRGAGLFAGAGALGLGTQIHLLREYMVALGGDEAAVGFGLAAWLLGITLGAAVLRLLTRPSPETLAGITLGLLAVAGWPALLGARLGRSVLGVPAGELISLGPALLLALAVFLLPGALVGGSFVTLAAATARRGVGAKPAIGTLYVVESLGSLAAGLWVSLVSIPLGAPLAGFAWLSAGALALCLPATQSGLVRGRRAFPALLAAALVAALVPTTSQLEELTQQMRFESIVTGLPLLEWNETPYQAVAIGGGDVRVLYENSEYVATFPDPEENEALAHQLMVLAETPRRVLALGGIETGLLRFCLLHAPERIDLTILDRRAFEVVRRHLGPADGGALADPRVHVHFEDPRRFLARSRESYDLVLLLQPDPATLLLARTATLEFGRLVFAHLAPRGVYVTTFSAGANTQTGATGRLGASLYRTLDEVFPVLRAAPGTPGLFVAGRVPDAVTLDPERLAWRYRSRGIESEVFVPELLPVAYPPERVATLERALRSDAQTFEPSRDDRPLSFLHALTLRQRVADSAWATLLTWGEAHPVWIGLASLAPSLVFCLLVGRRRRSLGGAAAVHATLVTGTSGMAVGLMLFFSFQTRVGALYSELGMLAGTFMLGLAVGGVWAARGGSLIMAELASTASALAVGLTFSLLDRFAPSGAWLGVLHWLLLLLAGAGTGAVFPAAAATLLAAGGNTRSAASSIELADHAGAALGALFTPALFVPVLGLGRSTLLLTVLLGLGSLAVLLGRHARPAPGSSKRRVPKTVASRP
ncbi:MAG: hypothetical protein JW751_15320 [Polyangiaceae bacterium]|nr:hypothetical protein [Polyangiaceae bacterium]